MKKYPLILIIVASMYSCTTTSNKKEDKIITPEIKATKYYEDEARSINSGIKVISKTRAKQEFKELSFVVEEFEYPEVTGFKDTVFEISVNEKIQQIITEKIEESKPKTPPPSDYAGLSPYGVIGFMYSIDCLSKNLLIISINYYTIYGGGNAWQPDLVLLFIDLKKKNIISPCNSIFDLSEITKEFINKKLDNYFTEMYANIENINISYIENTQVEQEQFTIRNDSLILCSLQWPTAHASFNIYKIPLLDLKKTGMKNEFHYLLER